MYYIVKEEFLTAFFLQYQLYDLLHSHFLLKKKQDFISNAASLTN